MCKHLSDNSNFISTKHVHCANCKWRKCIGKIDITVFEWCDDDKTGANLFERSSYMLLLLA
jgi:hypothetical protein